MLDDYRLEIKINKINDDEEGDKSEENLEVW